MESRRPLEEGEWTSHLTDDSPAAIVDFDGTSSPEEQGPLLLNATYAPMRGSLQRRIVNINQPSLDGRWLLVAQHLACWRLLWMPERANELPSMGLLMTRLLEAESVLEGYTK